MKYKTIVTTNIERNYLSWWLPVNQDVEVKKCFQFFGAKALMPARAFSWLNKIGMNYNKIVNFDVACSSQRVHIVLQYVSMINYMYTGVVLIQLYVVETWACVVSLCAFPAWKTQPILVEYTHWLLIWSMFETHHTLQYNIHSCSIYKDFGMRTEKIYTFVK